MDPILVTACESVLSTSSSFFTDECMDYFFINEVDTDWKVVESER